MTRDLQPGALGSVCSRPYPLSQTQTVSLPESDSQENPEGRNWGPGAWPSSTPSWEGPLRPQKGAGLSKDHTGVRGRTSMELRAPASSPELSPHTHSKGPECDTMLPQQDSRSGLWVGRERPGPPPQGVRTPSSSPGLSLKLPNPILRWLPWRLAGAGSILWARAPWGTVLLPLALPHRNHQHFLLHLSALPSWPGHREARPLSSFRLPAEPGDRDRLPGTDSQGSTVLGFRRKGAWNSRGHCWAVGLAQCWEHRPGPRGKLCSVELWSVAVGAQGAPLLSSGYPHEAERDRTSQTKPPCYQPSESLPQFGSVPA